MFKLLFTLLKGQAHAAEEALADGQALPLLDQQIREAASSHEQGRRALAYALAEAQREEARRAARKTRIAGLEDRARAALATGQETLTLEAARVIATLEADLADAEQAAARLQPELDRLREANAGAARRLNELQRGRHLAALSSAAQTARQNVFSSAPLAAAETTLARLRARQEIQALADAEFTAAAPESLEQKLAAAGCGPAFHPAAETVLARLRHPRLTQS
jgi:phage shock protein A